MGEWKKGIARGKYLFLSLSCSAALPFVLTGENEWQHEEVSQE
jgi:hypothetical protein